MDLSDQSSCFVGGNECFKRRGYTKITTSAKSLQWQSCLSIPSLPPSIDNLVMQKIEGGDLSSSSSSWLGFVEEETRDANTLVSDEMNKLTLDERECMYEDVHGVRKVIDENDEFISYHLYQLEIEISKTIIKESPYDIAKRQSPIFVSNKQFRLMFLRSCRFDVKLATKRIFKYFEEKLYYFGITKLTKIITLYDLNDNEIKCLKCGRFQLLPCRDSTGRPIMIVYRKKNTEFHEVDNFMRAMWYFLMSISEDEENQRKGFVVLFFSSKTHKSKDANGDIMKRVSRFVQCMPFYVACAHMCFTTSIMLHLTSIIINNNPGSIRTRVRIHDGSHTERLFSLLTFGIPIKHIPITDDGELKNNNHIKWINRRRLKDNTIITNKSFFNGIDLPAKYDVLFGRGSHIQDHFGNVHLRQLIEECGHSYKSSTEHGNKTIIAQNVIQNIKQTYKGRFLKQDKDGWWYEVSDTIALTKVSSRFRTYLLEQLQKKNNDSTTTATTTTTACTIQNYTTSNKRKKVF